MRPGGVGSGLLNPIQPRARGMEKERLKKGIRQTSVLLGGIDIQHTLPRGTPEQIRSSDAVRVLGKGGGMCWVRAQRAVGPSTRGTWSWWRKRR